MADPIRIASCSGFFGDRLPRMRELIAADQLIHFETGEPIKDASSFLTANAYFGGWGIVEALEVTRGKVEKLPERAKIHSAPPT